MSDDPAGYFWILAFALVAGLIVITLLFMWPTAVGAVVGWSYSIWSTRDQRQWRLWDWPTLGDYQRRVLRSSYWGADQRKWRFIGAGSGLIVSLILIARSGWFF